MDIESIATSAAVVAAEHEAAQAAQEAVIGAETSLLQKAVDAAKPALKAVSTRRRIAQRDFWVNVGQHVEFTRGPLALRVHGDGAERDYPRGNSGGIEGEDLYLNPDGTWTKAVYGGSWSKWQGATSSWECTDTTLTTREVAEEYDVDAILTSLAEALTKAVGTREKSTKAALERADKLSAIARLAK